MGRENIFVSLMIETIQKKQRKQSINEYLCDVNSEMMIDPPKPVLNEYETIVKYMQLKNCSLILVPLIMNREKQIISPIFYCTKCRKWLKISTTIRNVFSHIQKKHRSESQIQLMNMNHQNNQLEDNVKEIVYRLKAFIILNGYPFSDIENADLNSICHLQSRANLVRDVEKLSELTKNKIKSLLDGASNISIAVDEWQDRTKRRYLGVTAASIIERQYRIFTIAHTPIVEQKCDVIIIRKYLKKIIMNFGLLRRIQCAVTDNGGSVPAAFNDDPKIVEQDRLNIKRFPCICHIINLYAKIFHECMKDELDMILRVRSAFDTPCFTAFLIASQSPKVKISSFTSIRWTSLFNLLKI